MSSRTKHVKKVLIVGLPNPGKSLILTNLTGEFTIVANSPLTTQEKAQDRWKKARQLVEQAPWFRE